MDVSEAAALIRSAVTAAGGTWADFGAGSGLFTRALAVLVGPAGRIVAVDRDPDALSELRAAARGRPDGAEVVPVQADFTDPRPIPELDGFRLDGALFANALHFAPAPAEVLTRTASLLRDDAPVVLVEYDRSQSSPWVPYPIPAAHLPELAAEAGFGLARVVGRRPSAFGGTMYCAVLERAGS